MKGGDSIDLDEYFVSLILGLSLFFAALCLTSIVMYGGTYRDNSRGLVCEFSDGLTCYQTKE